MKVKNVIKSALRKLNAIGLTQEPNPAEYSNALEALNVMLESWSADIGELFYTSRESFTMVSGTAEYTIGTGADFNTDRPKSIVSGFVQYPGANTKYPLKVVDEERYDYQSLATTLGRPRMVFYDHNYPAGKLFFYYTPNANFTLTLKMKKRLGQFASINTDISLPEEYLRAMIFNLAVEVSDEGGFAPPNRVVKVASDSLRIVKKANFSNLMSDANLDSMLKRTRRRGARREYIYD